MKPKKKRDSEEKHIVSMDRNRRIVLPFVDADLRIGRRVFFGIKNGVVYFSLKPTPFTGTKWRSTRIQRVPKSGAKGLI